MVKVFFYIGLLFQLTSCQRGQYPYDEKGLTNRGKFIYANQIKMDGFFYHKHDMGNTGFRYFFENGYCSNYGVSTDIIIIECPEIDAIRSVPYFWGTFSIKNDTIFIQQVDSRREIFRKFKIVEDRIAIINDTTLHWFQKILSDKEVVKMDVWYKFHQCAHKPVSTNILDERQIK